MRKMTFELEIANKLTEELGKHILKHGNLNLNKEKMIFLNGLK